MTMRIYTCNNAHKELPNSCLKYNQNTKLSELSDCRYCDNTWFWQCYDKWCVK